MREHGGNIHLASRESGVPLRDIIDFSASINPLGVPETVEAVIRESICYLPHYPEPFAGRFARHLGAHLHIDPETILCGNGSTELIYLVVRALARGKVLIPAPTFSEYERACRMQQGTSCVRYALPREGHYDIDPDGFIAAMQGCGMAFLCNPNNPTGRIVKREALLALAEASRRMSCYLVVDEAFIDFAPEHSVIDEVARNSHLIVLRSLTKFYALSGLRIGYGVFPQALAASVKNYKEPWTVNTLAQHAGIAAINDHTYRKKTIAVIQEEKAFLEQELKRLGVEYLPSAANYYLLRLDNAQSLIAALRRKGILVRDCSNFPGLDGSYIRIAVRSREENKSLLKEFAKSCAA